MDAANTSNPSDKKKFIWLVILLIIAIVVAVVWWWNYRKYVSTIDANLDGSRVNVSVRAMAPLSAVFKQEGDSVKRGELLAVLDSTMTEDYRIVSPVDGLIAKQWVVPGDLLQPGENIFTLNEGKKLWVTGYLQETKVDEVRMGQQALFTLDAYPGLTFYGKIFYIGANTASEFSLIPPDNASGNYTKVAQRIPLKISIDRVEGKEKLKANLRLLSGMSANVKIVKE